jgi:hypothetical protein
MARTSRKGKGNLRTQVDTLRLVELMNELNFCPPAKLIDLHNIAIESFANEPDQAGVRNPQYLTIAQKCASDLMPYLYPKRKIIEVDPSEETKKMLGQMSNEQLLQEFVKLTTKGE